MIKVTALALLIALCNAEKDRSSRLLLQAAAPPQAQGPPAIPPVPPQTQPQNPAGLQPPAIPPQQPSYNPYGTGNAPGMNMQNPYCNPMSPLYDLQDCYQYSYLYGNNNNPGQGQGAPGINMNNPYCNPASPMFDYQDCIQYGGMYQQYQPQAPPAMPRPQVQPPNIAAPPQGQTPGQGPAGNPSQGQGQAQGGINMNNPYCNPMSQMYDIQDCIQTGGMTGGQFQPGANSQSPFCNPASGRYDPQDCIQYGSLWYLHI